ncbi:OLC1v1028193C1 [Oldenlandia corymbosa var. corymbosa]|uniref:OLC1v1028193C1 n=1 Tax=Oldenlandia corymbosa var. corymbosa TaxID=529605 RepID=A0AAV1CBF2_OLDCO|nr:OLC1v1028193C1 [Oldenlandia corymbosa var. corymbosa]
MGNCQAVDAAALVIQHPSGKIDRLYWPVTASEVMKMNPGHYVSLIIPLPMAPPGQAGSGGGGGGGDGDRNSDDRTIRFTRVKLLRPSETLVLGRAYRLVTTQEVMKVLKAKKYAKMKNHQPAIDKLESQLPEKQGSSGGAEPGKSELDNNCQVNLFTP